MNMCSTIIVLICFLGFGVNGESADKASLLELSKRSAQTSLDYLPDDFPMDVFQNASVMACSDIITIPSIKLMQMTDNQMKAMFKDMGGSYVQDYMAATLEEALNFPNIIKLSDPFQNSSSDNYSVSVYDNFIAKQVIVNDMQKLLFYFLNKTASNGQPVMGMKVNGIVDSGSTTVTSGPVRPLTPSTYPTPIPVYTKPPTMHYLKPSLPPPIQSNLTAQSSGKTSSDSVQTGTTGSHSWLNHLQTSLNSTLSSVLNSSAPSVSASTTATVPSSAATQQASSARDAVTSTVDPYVANSLEQLSKYLSGGVFGGESLNLSARDLDKVWREANTTLHPSRLLGLSLANLRMRREAPFDDDNENDTYCQNKGALTSDRKFMHLCSSCASTTKLSDDYFPRYINEAVCKQNDNACFQVGNTAHGECKQNVFSLRIMKRRRGMCAMVLHNGQTMAVDDWHLTHKAIRVSCECTIDKRSLFRQYVVAVG